MSLVLVYLAYWVSSWLLGSRYYFEALPGLALLSAAGIIWLAGVKPGVKDGGSILARLRPLGIAVIVSLLIFSNLYFYLPARLGGLQGLYGIERADLKIFESAEVKAYQPALVIVDSEEWMPYGSTLVLETPGAGLPFDLCLELRTENKPQNEGILPGGKEYPLLLPRPGSRKALYLSPAWFFVRIGSIIHVANLYAGRSHSCQILKSPEEFLSARY